MKKIAVRELAYFECQSGDLTNEFSSNHDAEAGNRAHTYLQGKYGEDDVSEYYIKYPIFCLGKEYELHGFIDGVLYEDEIIIEEIKSTNKELEEIDINYHKEHMAQLKIYGYLYALTNHMESIHLRLTYISIIDYDTKSFDYIFTIDELEDFTLDKLTSYIDWLNTIEEAKLIKEKTIKEIKFPFENQRLGQRDLMKATYQALSTEDILYCIAPTGIGKTMATLFSALKTLKDNDKLFYLTAKGSGKNAPIEAIKILSKEQGLKMKVIDIVAKRKICNRHSKNCEAEDCPFAKGYFDRLKEATEEIFKNYDLFDEETITNVSNKHQICAFEFSLYLSYYCDLVIADYNYAFDPVAHLVRYFEDDTYKPKLLIDEAHNLVSRSKEMYSAVLNSIDLRHLRSVLNGFKPSIRKDINLAIEIMESYLEQMADKALICDNNQNLELATALRNVILKCDTIFDENPKMKNKDEAKEVYFKLLDYTRVADIFSPAHKMLIKKIDDYVEIDLYCLDASEFILNSIKQTTHGVVFFSATLHPLIYHMNLLTKGEGKFLELKSPFDPNNLDIIINPTVSTKYKDREVSVDSIIEAIETTISVHPGNYIVFFPSYQYMKMVLDSVVDPNYEIIEQTTGLSDIERQEIIDKFKTTNNTKVGFFVMGGIFSEGVDFIGDSLSGVIIVGVGLPLYCDENNILKEYFDKQYEKGFEYAYMYPGITKVIQSVGRVIRSETDKGIALLIDERFNQVRYHNLYPNHWTNKRIVNSSYSLKKELEQFYNK